ncbi:MAG: S-layer homology domain-containing protein [Firmicutes bacterium]|nr:S-layer homology domain-containing protein [Bacillota bacterium]
MITRKSKFLSAMLSVCMTFSAVPAVYAAGDGAGTSDIDGHWAKTALEEFIKDGYLNGDGNGNYMPNGTMTRAQFSAIVNRILRYTDESADISKYRDVSASAW